MEKKGSLPVTTIALIEIRSMIDVWETAETGQENVEENFK